MEIKGVSIGDKFITPGKVKRVATVIYIYTVTNSKGDVVRHECMASHILGNQEVKYHTPFATVMMNKLK